MRCVATREQLHNEVDAVPEEALERAHVVIEPVADEAQPGDVVDDWGNLSAMKRRSSARLMKRLSEEEIAANGQTLADAWGYKQKHPR
jgi:hypothetical protein